MCSNLEYKNIEEQTKTTSSKLKNELSIFVISECDQKLKSFYFQVLDF